MKWASPQCQPLLHLPEKTCVELVQRLKGGEDGVLQGVRSCLILSHGTLERLVSRIHAYSDLSSHLTREIQFNHKSLSSLTKPGFWVFFVFYCGLPGLEYNANVSLCRWQRLSTCDKQVMLVTSWQDVYRWCLNSIRTSWYLDIRLIVGEYLILAYIRNKILDLYELQCCAKLLSHPSFYYILLPRGQIFLCFFKSSLQQ